MTRRRIFLVGGTFTVLLLAYLVYNATSGQGVPGIWRWNPKVTPSRDNPEAVQGIGDIWPTVNPRVEQRDKNGRLQAVFQAVSQKKDNDRFYVDKPELEWYLKSGEVVVVKADKGMIKADYHSSGRWRIKEGELSGNVWVILDRSKDSDRLPLEERPEDAFRIHLDHARFDNELLSIYSDSALNLFSKEADLLGKGLRIEWSEGPRELLQVRIEHGEYMCIREGQERFMGDFTLPGSAPKLASSAPAGAPAPSGPADARDKESSSVAPLSGAMAAIAVMSATAPASAPADLVVDELVNQLEPTTTASVPATAAGPPVGAAPMTTMLTLAPAIKDTFVAVFHGDVKVTSGPRLIQGADELRVTFDYHSTQREDHRSSAISTLAKQSQEYASRPATATAPALTTTRKGAPKSRPGQKGEPVYITWNGPLVITPLRDNSERIERRLDVEMSGAKLKLADGQSQVQCKRVTYNARTQQARLEGTAEEPVHMWTANGEEIFVETVCYDRTSGTIHLEGPGRMELAETAAAMSGGADGKGQKEPAHIEWADNVVAEVGQLPAASSPDGKSHSYIKKAVFKGKALLRQGKTQEMRGDEVVVTFAVPEGKANSDAGEYQARPSRLEAFGHVRIIDLTDKPPLEIEAESVESDLIAKTARLKGSPAKVTQKEGSIQGQDIFMDRQRELAAAKGVGKLQFYTDSDLSGNKTGKRQPVDVAWSKSMEYRGKDFIADVVGDVRLDTAEDHLRCQSMRVYFDPNDRPKESASGSADRLTGPRTFRPQKLRLVLAHEKVQLTSERKDDEGYLERRMWLAGDQMTYSFARNNGKEEGSLSCPGPGMGSVEDYRSPEAAEAAEKNRSASDVKLITPNQSAFQWSKSMTMDQKDRSMRFSGDVHMVLREGDAVVMAEKLNIRPWGKLPAGKSSDLSCQSLLVQFDEPVESQRGGDQTGPRVGQLRTFHARGADSKADDLIRLVVGDREVHCRYMEYKRDTDMGVIYGSLPGEPPRDAVLYFEGKSTASPQFVWYRANDRIEAKNVRGRGSR